MKTHVIFSVCLLMSLVSCTVVRQGEVGVKRTLGKIKPQPLTEGMQVFNPLTATVLKVPTRTINIEVRMPLPDADQVPGH